MMGGRTGPVRAGKTWQPASHSGSAAVCTILQPSSSPVIGREGRREGEPSIAGSPQLIDRRDTKANPVQSQQPQPSIHPSISGTTTRPSGSGEGRRGGEGGGYGNPNRSSDDLERWPRLRPVHRTRLRKEGRKKPGPAIHPILDVLALHACMTDPPPGATDLLAAPLPPPLTALARWFPSIMLLPLAPFVQLISWKKGWPTHRPAALAVCQTCALEGIFRP
ncbi:hypothetical protein BO71DRAFT_58652 [Aspergillus ellipticus CBS 707.79]|uniref:Uncharacterized protein n=1 Tax=Aspergillus ellipticus CBS 707.79 TaxID=1448320 RepID=A0A319E3T3_9EURO|nr:hypothetical protein BO71DRAFT_58652 [Aspergillus ellipticus CBS 707.79]